MNRGRQNRYKKNNREKNYELASFEKAELTFRHARNSGDLHFVSTCIYIRLVLGSDAAVIFAHIYICYHNTNSHNYRITCFFKKGHCRPLQLK